MNGIPEPYLANAQEEGGRKNWQDSKLPMMLEAIYHKLENWIWKEEKKSYKNRKGHF